MDHKLSDASIRIMSCSRCLLLLQRECTADPSFGAGLRHGEYADFIRTFLCGKLPQEREEAEETNLATVRA